MTIRGLLHSRRYGRAHRALRREWAPQVATGQVQCWRCQQLIGRTEPWHLGHDDHDPSRYRGPEHVVCNVAASNRPVEDPTPTVRAWW